jgi:hypothetical protein
MKGAADRAWSFNVNCLFTSNRLSPWKLRINVRENYSYSTWYVENSSLSPAVFSQWYFRNRYNYRDCITSALMHWGPIGFLLIAAAQQRVFLENQAKFEVKAGRRVKNKAMPHPRTWPRHAEQTGHATPNNLAMLHLSTWSRHTLQLGQDTPINLAKTHLTT